MLFIKYPIYIVSKGRADNILTANVFLKENIPFLIAVESNEYDSYKNYFDEKLLLKLPFSNLGLGSYPARNFCWNHSVSLGYQKHFIFDDNIRCFSRLNNGKRTKTNAMTSILVLQSISDRYENLAMSGFNYRYFVTNDTNKAFTLNTHVYSGMLINNKIPFRWRLKYNEDVDLNLQCLHNKWCTMLLNSFLIDKISTAVKMKGGNQSELYKNNDPKKKMLKARSLEIVWPQYVKTVFKFNRPHHSISWGKHFKHGLIKKQNYNEIIDKQRTLFNEST
jgi:hypothetical protein